MISVALLCAQGVGLHIHNFDHGADHPSLTAAIDGDNSHLHISKAHSAHDATHSDHHTGIGSEIDIKPDGLVKNFNPNFAIALVVFLVIFVALVASRKLVYRRWNDDHALSGYYVLSPPLRAPPQY